MQYLTPSRALTPLSAFQAKGNTTAGVAVVVPVYHSEQSLAELVRRVGDMMTQRGEAFELILVNDGSRDRSWDRIVDLTRDRPWIRGVNLLRNYGQHNALLCGIREARYDVIVTMDDDLQNPPEEIPRLIERLEEGYDVVYGIPAHEQHGLWRDLASQITKIALASAIGADTARNVSAFRAFRTQVRDAFANYRSPYVSIDVLLTWGTTQFAAVKVHHEPRRIGGSNYTFRRLVTHALNMMTGFSTMPLQLASLVGFAFTLFGVGVLIYVVARYLIQGGGVPGFPFLASLISIFAGAQLFSIGIIGEYLARMYFRMMERPAYVVRSAVELGQTQP